VNISVEYFLNDLSTKLALLIWSMQFFHRCWYRCCYEAENQSCTDTWEYDRKCNRLCRNGYLSNSRCSPKASTSYGCQFWSLRSVLCVVEFLLMNTECIHFLTRLFPLLYTLTSHDNGPNYFDYFWTLDERLMQIWIKWAYSILQHYVFWL
jgi:hypothetical protein